MVTRPVAAALSTGVCGEIPDSAQNVLVLLRKSGLGEALAAVRVSASGESGCWFPGRNRACRRSPAPWSGRASPVAFALSARQAHGFLSSTPDLVPLYRAAGSLRGGFVPTPYPVEETVWDFSIPIAERRGIFVGTREFTTPSRNHFLALSSISGFDQPITVINTEGWTGARLLRSISPNLRIVSGKLPYSNTFA